MTMAVDAERMSRHSAMSCLGILGIRENDEVCKRELQRTDVGGRYRLAENGFAGKPDGD
jgi:hypothetical protein